MQVLPPAPTLEGAAAHQREEQLGHQERADATVHRRRDAHAWNNAGELIFAMSEAGAMPAPTAGVWQMVDRTDLEQRAAGVNCRFVRCSYFL